MRGGFWKMGAALTASGCLALGALAPAARADDNGFFGRLFRLGGNSSQSSGAAGGSSSTSRNGFPGGPAPRSAATSASAYGDIGSGGSFIPPAGSVSRAPNPTPVSGPISSDGPSTPDISGTPDAHPRIAPRPRTSAAVTSADPLLTRMALGRSNDGSQFAMLLQVFTDGTVIDSDGVHRLSPADLRPLLEATQNSELARVRGHCGTPSSDFIEYVHIIVFERRMGRLQAHAFSYAGNPQGCDSGIRYLHTAIENLQAKLSRQPASSASAAGTSSLLGPATGSPRPAAAPYATPVPLGGSALAAPPLPDPSAVPGGGATSGSVIRLTPLPLH